MPIMYLMITPGLSGETRRGSNMRVSRIFTVSMLTLAGNGVRIKFFRLIAKRIKEQ